MDKTVTIDMSAHIAGWRQGVADGQAYAGQYKELPPIEKLDELASPTAPPEGNPKRDDWLSGYHKGFREGVKKVLSA